MVKNWVSTFYFTPKKPGARNFEIDYSLGENNKDGEVLKGDMLGAKS